MELGSGDKQKWRHDHIPHRVRAAIARLDMRESILNVQAVVEPITTTDEEEVYWHCAKDAIWEGRLAAARWLIEFVGVKQFDGKPRRPERRRDDVGIECFDGGCDNLFKLEGASFLADVWEGCTKASSHATYNSNHPSVEGPELAQAVAAIVSHLQDTIYQRAGENIRDHVLRP